MRFWSEAIDDHPKRPRRFDRRRLRTGIALLASDARGRTPSPAVGPPVTVCGGRAFTDDHAAGDESLGFLLFASRPRDRRLLTERDLLSFRCRVGEARPWARMTHAGPIDAHQCADVLIR